MITIVTDSSSYFKKNEARKLGLRVIPLNYTAGDRQYSESFADQNGDFENLLKGRGKFTTSHPNMAAFLSCFEEELQQGNEVLCVTISSRLSGCFSTAYMAAQQAKNGGIAVFDSQLTAGGLYLLVKAARRLIDDGLTLGEVLGELPSIRDKIAITFSVDDMDPLRNSGRIGFVRMSIGTILNFKPILLCRDGAVVSDGIARGNAEIIKKFVEKIGIGAQEIVISYIGENRLASHLYHVLKDTFGGAEITLQKIGPVLGIHLGLQVIAVSFTEL